MIRSLVRTLVGGRPLVRELAAPRPATEDDPGLTRAEDERR